MHCPICSHQETKVIDSRISSEGSSVRRRRECEKCGFRFTTGEEVELLDLVVVKRDGRHDAYSRDKLAQGLRKSLEKRPYTDAAFRNLLSAIERDIQKKKTNEITSAEMGELVMDRLKGFDKVAYIRFASVYRQFEDVESFSKELETLKAKRRRRKDKTGENRSTNTRLDL